jgi:hypothetical protein
MGTVDTMSEAWINDHRYIRLSAELAASEASDFARRVLPLIRLVWADTVQVPALGSFDRRGIDFLVWSNTEPFPLVVQCKGFRNLEIGLPQLQQCQNAINSFRNSGLKAKVYLLIHNRAEGNKKFKDVIEVELRQLIEAKQVERAELWDRERLVCEVHKKELEPFNSAIQKLKDIPPGKDKASEFQKHIKAILELLFPCDLRPLHLEQTVFGGLKRLDILAFNKSKSGFFYSLKQDHSINCPVIVVECKNYQHELGNPEFDQIGSRLGRKIGLFGILAYRQASDRHTVIRRCQNFFDNDERVVLPLGDSDFEELLTLKMCSKDEEIEYYLDRILLEVKAGYLP